VESGLNSKKRYLHLCKIRLQREIEVTNRQIDQLVYELYGLTAEEMRIVKGDA
jgi:hypothetical protein